VRFSSAPKVEGGFWYHGKKLSNEVLDKYVARYTEVAIRKASGYESCGAFVFPLYDLDARTLLDITFFTTSGRQLQGNFKTKLVNTAISLFGCHLQPTDTKKLVITDNEFDALAVHQASGLPVVCPLPAGSCLSDHHMRYIDQFDSVVLWTGRNSVNRRLPLQLGTQFLPGKCCFVSPPKDSPLMRCSPLDAINNEIDVKQLIREAQPLCNEKIMSFRELSNNLHDELLNGDQIAGVSWRRFPMLTKILKGHRRGELTVLTGPTGSGKTTFMSELSLDLCLQGVPTLWGSFEIRNVRLARTMICQLAGFNIEDQMEEYSQWAKQLESLPLYFMNFHGSQSLKSVIETMTHAVYAYNIEHVVIDNLQFMISSQLMK
jgi:twinkle protein